jgi:hypothetical protein
MDILGWVSSWPSYVHAVFGIVSAATALTALTPTKVDDRVLSWLLTALNILAGNVLKNRNKDA